MHLDPNTVSTALNTQPPNTLSNAAGWISAVGALISSIMAFLAIYFSRSNNKGVLSVYKIDKHINITPTLCIFQMNFGIKNFGRENVVIKKTFSRLYDPINNQLTLLHSYEGDFPYFPQADYLNLSMGREIKPPYPATVSLQNIDSQGNLAFYGASFPTVVAIITIEYTRKGFLLNETIKDHHYYEIGFQNGPSPTSVETYPFLKGKI